MTISVENRKIFPPPCAPAEGFSMELGNSTWGQKTRVMGLPGRERNLTISSTIWIQSTNMTDGRTPSHSKDHAYV